MKRIVVLTAALLVAHSTWAEGAPRLEVPAKKPGVLRVVCFGDSITGHRPLRAYQHLYIKYADLLQVALEAHLGAGKAEVLNSGWAGDRTFPKPNERWPGAVGRLDEDLIDLNPDIAVVLISGNDGSKDPEQTAKNLDTIVSRVKQAGIKLLMLKYHPALASPENEAKAWHHLDDHNPAIQAAADKHKVPTLDMGPPMLAAEKQCGRAALCNEKDGVHLKPRGEIVYANAIFIKLKALNWLTIEE
jgi:lysophospholipase L1-like esterase